jgi:hypothetical protein
MRMRMRRRAMPDRYDALAAKLILVAVINRVSSKPHEVFLASRDPSERRNLNLRFAYLKNAQEAATAIRDDLAAMMREEFGPGKEIDRA